jgi:hypothetical protein
MISDQKGTLLRALSSDYTCFEFLAAGALTAPVAELMRSDMVTSDIAAGHPVEIAVKGLGWRSCDTGNCHSD